MNKTVIIVIIVILILILIGGGIGWFIYSRKKKKQSTNNSTSGSTTGSTSGSTTGSTSDSTGSGNGTQSDTSTKNNTSTSCINQGGYIMSDGTCMTNDKCLASGGTFSKSLMKCSPYTSASCKQAGGVWQGDIIDCNFKTNDSSKTYTCTCGPTGCGNGAVGADPGNKTTQLSENQVKQNYRPCDNIGGSSTGWNCINDQSGQNFCEENN